MIMRIPRNEHDGSMTGPYAGRRIQHGKERVIAPVLDASLGCRVERVSGFDTDTLGTFSRDIPRAGSQMEAAYRKARIGMELSGLPLGLAGEGAFVPDLMTGLFPWNVELLALIDAEDLVARLNSPCPACTMPGFWIVERVAGLPCGDCGLPTREIRADIYGCRKCDYRKVHARAGINHADPGRCDYCNP